RSGIHPSAATVHSRGDEGGRRCYMKPHLLGPGGGQIMAIKFGRPIEMRGAERRDAETQAPTLDLAIRPRRNRKAEWARRPVRENVLTTNARIWRVFVVDGDNRRTPVASMPGVERLTVDQVVRDAERAMKLDIPCIALFPFTEPSLRDE